MPASPVMIGTPVDGDLHAIAELLSVCYEHDLGELEPVESVLTDLRADWSRDGFDPAGDAWLASDPAGAIVGYAHLVPFSESLARISSGGVRPERRRQGIGTELVARAEERA